MIVGEHELGQLGRCSDPGCGDSESLARCGCWWSTDDIRGVASRREHREELRFWVLVHGVASIVSSWSWDARREIGTLSLKGSSSASASDFRSVLGFLQLRSAAASSDSYRRILVRPDISGSAFRKDFHVREVKVYVNDAPEASKVPDKRVDEDATATYVVPAFTDDEDTELEYEAKLVVGGGEQDPPAWIDFDEATRTFTFTPLGTHVGVYTLRVTGTDAGGLSDFVDFVVTVAEVNDAPEAPPAGLADPDDVLEDTSPTYVFDAFDGRGDLYAYVYILGCAGKG